MSNLNKIYKIIIELTTSSLIQERFLKAKLNYLTTAH
jgi:hypothetical protein